MAEDLRNTPYAQEIERFLDRNVARGNEGDATIERLEKNGSVISFSFKIKHRHVNKIKIPLNGTKTIVVYQATSSIDGSTDLANPNPDDLKFSINTPLGAISFSLADLLLALLA
jgi:hypothetical protein